MGVIQRWLEADHTDLRFVPHALRFLQSARVFAFTASHMRAPVQLVPEAVLAPDGSNLAVVLDRLVFRRRLDT